MKAGEKYTKAAENLFNFVWAADTEAVNSTFELEIIDTQESIDLFKRFFVNLDEEGDIAVDKKTGGDVQKFFEEIIIFGKEYKEQKKQEHASQTFNFEEVKNAMNCEVNEDTNSFEINAGLKDLPLSQANNSNSNYTDQKIVWSAENILLSEELLHIVKSKKILSKLTNEAVSLINRNKNTIYWVLIESLKKLRLLYYAWLKETWSKRLGSKKTCEIIAGFTNRKISEVVIEDDVNQSSTSEVTSESHYEDPNLSNMNVEINYREIFQKWMIKEGDRAKSRVPSELLKMMRGIVEQEKSNRNGVISDEVNNIVNTLNNIYYYDYLQGNYNEETLTNTFIKTKLGWKKIKRIINNIRIEIEDTIVSCFVKILQVSNLFKINYCAFILSKLIWKRKLNTLSLLRSRITKSSYFIYGQNKEFHFRLEWNKAVSKWENKYLNRLSD